MSRPSVPHRWGVILAGGEGARLRPLTRTLAGDDRPKQFCAILGDSSLLEGTRRRVVLGVAPQRTLVVVTRTRERFYVPALASMRAGAVVVQPENRGTGPAVLYALLRLTTLAPRDRVAFFPADHHVSDDRAFMSHVEAAFEASAERPDLGCCSGSCPMVWTAAATAGSNRVSRSPGARRDLSGACGASPRNPPGPMRTATGRAGR